MKPEADTVRSRNARLNQALRHAADLVAMLKPERRPDNEDAWNALFAEARDDANDIHQCVHEASAYHNVLKD